MIVNDKRELILSKLTEFSKGMGFTMWVSTTSIYPEVVVKFEDPAPAGSGQWEIISIFVDKVENVELTVNSITDHLIEKFGYGDGVLM